MINELKEKLAKLHAESEAKSKRITEIYAEASILVDERSDITQRIYDLNLAIREANKMREIKFRFWCKTVKSMIDVNNSGQFVIGLDGRLRDMSYPFTSQMKPIDDVVIMQFTGLTDKNGVDIYEGDIVSSDFYSPEVDCVAPVKYHNELMRFVFDDGEQDAYEYGRLTVIGNIHQNPELIEAQKNDR